MTRDDLKVLVAAPFKADAATLAKILLGRYQAEVCADVESLASKVGGDTSVILITEEALLAGSSHLGAALESQPTWSDIPIILLASNHSRAGKDNAAARKRLPMSATNVVVLERPMSSSSLLSAITAAWRARERQFEMRDRLAELAQERERFRILLENVPVGISFVDLNGTSLVSNPLYDHYVPGNVTPAYGQPAEDEWFLVDEHGVRLKPEHFPSARALSGEFVEGVVFRHRASDGVDSWIRSSAVPLRSPTGEIIGAALVIVDINDQKRAELSLREFNESLEIEVAARTQALATAMEQLQAESQERELAENKLRHSLKMEAVGQLTGGIAHDFNNMLTGVLGALDLINLRLSKGSVEGLGRYLDAAQVSARRAASLTQRLLAFSRRQSLDTKAVRVNELISTLHDLLTRSVNEQINIVLELSDSDPWILADANQLENALLNLVINARDAMPHGGMIKISTHTQQIDEQLDDLESLKPGQYTRVQVADTGSGIPPALLARVIEPFFTTKPQGQGTGLGLSMVYGFAKQSHGQLHISSIPDTGTTVSIYLPAVSASTADERTEIQEAAAGTGQVILLVEDDDSVRMLNAEVLEELGYTVQVAIDGIAALEILESMPKLDLLVTDVGLPGINGRQLAEIAQQQRPKLPVLFLTGYAEGATSRPEYLGMHMELLTKPFALQDLADAVSRMLRPS